MAGLSQENMPAHVGVIMDGNGRWALARGLPRVEGHRRGAERAMEIIRAASEIGIQTLTLYTFSLENWQRPESEVSLLMKLLVTYLKKEVRELVRGGIRFRTIGETWKLPQGIQSLLRDAEQKTSANTGMTLVSALSYGGRDEILRAVKKAVASGLPAEDITEEYFSSLLDTAGLPQPDLIIRTSGEKRISNFLLWQSAYSELYFTDVLWPDFTREELTNAVLDYRMRERRFGSVPVRNNHER
jgi:undecaprenyl diphosphate synthase